MPPCRKTPSGPELTPEQYRVTRTHGTCVKLDLESSQEGQS